MASNDATRPRPSQISNLPLESLIFVPAKVTRHLFLLTSHYLSVLIQLEKKESSGFEWARQVEPSLIGLKAGQAELLNDDRVGRALDKLFDADRAALMTELVLATLREFKVDVDQLHNDSTTLTLTGDYKEADGSPLRGKPTLLVTYGHNKDYRPDLKQILFVLTISADGAVPVHYRAMDGNTNDSTTHIATWEALRKIARRADFLYVADCKLCSKISLGHINKQGGRFITVLPRNRREDRWFRNFF